MLLKYIPRLGAPDHPAQVLSNKSSQKEHIIAPYHVSKPKQAEIQSQQLHAFPTSGYNLVPATTCYNVAPWRPLPPPQQTFILRPYLYLLSIKKCGLRYTGFLWLAKGRPRKHFPHWAIPKIAVLKSPAGHPLFLLCVQPFHLGYAVHVGNPGPLGTTPVEQFMSP
jgi:hypothetical protein